MYLQWLLPPAAAVAGRHLEDPSGSSGSETLSLFSSRRPNTQETETTQH